MGGAESQDERAEEEREDPPAKRREITKLESMEERLAFFERHLRHHFISRKDFWNFEDISNLISRAEEEEAASAKRRVIMKLELMEERLAFFEEHLPHRDPFISSSLTFPFTMGGAVSLNVRAEEEREAASAKRREIREKELMEERLTFIDFLTMPFTMSGVKKIFRSVMRQLEALKRSEMVMSMQRDQPMELLQPLKLPDPPSMDHLWSHEPGPHLSSHNSSLVKERAVSPAPSCVSMKSARSMNFPISFKRPATCESVKSDQSMGPPIKRDPGINAGPWTDLERPGRTWRDLERPGLHGLGVF